MAASRQHVSGNGPRVMLNVTRAKFSLLFSSRGKAASRQRGSGDAPSRALNVTSVIDLILSSVCLVEIFGKLNITGLTLKGLGPFVGLVYLESSWG